DALTSWPAALRERRRGRVRSALDPPRVQRRQRWFGHYHQTYAKTKRTRSPTNAGLGRKGCWPRRRAGIGAAGPHSLRGVTTIRSFFELSLAGALTRTD